MSDFANCAEDFKRGCAMLVADEPELDAELVRIFDRLGARLAAIPDEAAIQRQAAVAERAPVDARMPTTARKDARQYITGSATREQIERMFYASRMAV